MDDFEGDMGEMIREQQETNKLLSKLTGYLEGVMSRNLIPRASVSFFQLWGIAKYAHPISTCSSQSVQASRDLL
jgi:hypothetical protein